MAKLFTNEKETKRAIKAAVDQFRMVLKKQPTLSVSADVHRNLMNGHKTMRTVVLIAYEVCNHTSIKRERSRRNKI